MTDVLIAGGGIAGATAAILLGRAGLRVALFEQHSFPRDKPCAEGIMPAGVGVLQRLGLADQIGGAPFVGIRYHGWGRTVGGHFPVASGVPTFGLGQRRLVLDRVLFETAQGTPGVTAHQAAQVDGPMLEGGRVTGLVVGGRIHRAALTVGADGPRSRIRNAAGLDGPPGRHPRLGVRAHFRLPATDSTRDHVEIFVGDDHELYLTPLPDNEIVLAALSTRAELEGNVRDVFPRWVAQHPALATRLRGAESSSNLAGRTPLASRARAGVFPGLVLLGDAAGFLDPVTGSGIAQALLSAELLTRVLVPAHGFHPSFDLLLEFDRHRRALLRDYAILTRFVLAIVGRPAWGRRMLALMDRSPLLFSHLIGVAGGTRPLVPL